MKTNYITMNFKDISIDELLKHIEQVYANIKQEQENIYDIIAEDTQLDYKIDNDDNDIDNQELNNGNDYVVSDDSEDDSDAEIKTMITVKIYEADEEDDDLFTHLTKEDEDENNSVDMDNEETDDDMLFDTSDADQEDAEADDTEKQISEMYTVINSDGDIQIASIFTVENLSRLEIQTDENLSFIRLYHPLISALEFVHVSDNVYTESTNISANIPGLVFFGKNIGLTSRNILFIELEPNNTINSIAVDLNSKQVIINPPANEFLGDLTELPFAKVIDLLAQFKQ